MLIADDHPMFRDGILALLAATPDLVAVGEARTGDEAVELSAALMPDLILMDIQMPGCSGIEATRRILAATPAVRVLIVSMFEDDASIFTAMRAGARGYILKDADRADILRAIRAVGQGEAIFAPSIASRVLEYFATPARTVAAAEFPELTEREGEILELIARGHRNADIARRLVLSPNTVRNYVSSIFTKLQVADRGHAIIRARKAGLGDG
ncbi:response regulator [Dactylosporangium sp. McL0621]|uniref:response regulator n=1 Tax=Dactylosporangium sp. McL0621 TaxID=3415678 RepID=UPI003CEA5046